MIWRQGTDLSGYDLLQKTKEPTFLKTSVTDNIIQNHKKLINNVEDYKTTKLTKFIVNKTVQYSKSKANGDCNAHFSLYMFRTNNK